MLSNSQPQTLANADALNNPFAGAGQSIPAASLLAGPVFQEPSTPEVW